METTTHLPQNLKLSGLHLKACTERYPVALSAVAKLADSQLAAQFTLHIFEDFDFEREPLEWAVTAVSSAGRRTHEISQRSALGAVFLDGKVYCHARNL